MVLAAEALAEHGSLGQFTVDGAAGQGRAEPPLRPRRARRQDRRPSPTPAQATAELVTTVSGSPVAPEPAASQRLRGRADALCRSTARSSTLKSLAQNERVVVALKVTESEARYARLHDRRPAAGRARDRQSGARRRRLGRGLLVAHDRRDAGAYRISRRPLRRGVRPRRRASRPSSPSPMSRAPSRPAATSGRPRPPRTCTLPNASAAPPSARSR